MEIRSPVRATRRYLQHLDGPAAQVFALLCPVREADYVAGWDPRLVLSESGLVERDCVFTTEDGGREATWVVTEHEPADHRVEMVKVVPGHTVTRLRIVLRPGVSTACQAEITYAWTALSPEGEEFVRGRTEEVWGAFMREWEDEMNAYLGKRSD